MDKPLKILVIDDDSVIRDACEQTLARTGHEVDLAVSGADGLALANRWTYDVVLLDLRMPDLDGMSVLAQLIEQDPSCVVIVISGFGSVQNAVQAMKLGAFDFLAKPFSPDELRRAVERAQEKRQLLLENAYLREELRRKSAPTDVVTTSPAMARVLEMLERVAPTDSTVLLTGESGTGKGLLAHRLHDLSARSEMPFVTVDCSTLVPTLFESELFGHVKGSFTGADANKIGKFELAGRGTLFFDEVSNISLEMQAKLLKAVEERAVTKVGSNKVVRVDFRLVAASNRDLAAEVKSGRFREDLFYRLNVLHIHLPPLRSRPEDVAPLAQHFREHFRGLSSQRVRGFTPQALQALAEYPWPGNVRELQNTVQRMVVLARRNLIDRDEVEAALPRRPHSDQEPLALADAEARHIARVLRRCRGHISNTAAALGIDRKTLRTKIRKYGLSVDVIQPADPVS